TPWMEASLEQRFVRVDVPDTCNYPLIEKHGFQEPGRSRQLVAPVFCAELEWLRPEPYCFEKALDSRTMGNHRGAAETAYVTEAQLRLARMQIEHEVSVAGGWLISPQDPQLTGHPQMED